MEALHSSQVTRQTCRYLPGCENLFVLQLLHAGGGCHRHGDHDVVDVKGAFTSPPLDGLLLVDKQHMNTQNEGLISRLLEFIHH